MFFTNYRILIFFLLFRYIVCNSEKLLIVKDFFKYYNLKSGILLTCENSIESVKAFRILSTEGIRINILEPMDDLSAQPSLFITEYYKTGIVLDLKCENSESLLNNLSSNDTYYIFKYTNVWLLINDSSIYDNVEFFNSLNINIDSEIYFAEWSLFFEYKIYEVYNSGPKNFGKLFVNEIGTWTVTDGFKLRLTEYKYVRRSNMTGVVLRCMIVVTKKIRRPMQEYISSPTETHIDSMNRFNYALLLHLKDIYNFRYSVERTTSWGYFHNGTVDGMIGHLQQKLVDIGGSPIFFRLERAEVIDYTIQTWVSRPCFMFRHPLERSSVTKIFIRPFESRVWYCAIAVTVLAVAGLYFLIKQEHQLIQSQDDVSWGFAWLFTLGAIFQQGMPYRVLFTSGKIVILSIFFYSLLFYQYYSASIVSSLLMAAPKTIKTLENLLHSHLKIGVEDIIYNRDYFAKTTDPIAIKLFKEKIGTSNASFLKPSEGLRLVKKGGYAFHIDIATAYKIIRDTFTENQVCELSEIQLFPPQKTVAIVQKGSPFRKLVSYGLRKIAESGLMARQKMVWHERKPQCVRRPDQTQLIKVSLREFLPAMVILAAGMVASVVTLLVEMKMKRYKPY